MPLLTDEVKRLDPARAFGRRLLLLPICNALILSVVLALITRVCVNQGWIPPAASGTGLGAVLDFLTFSHGTDSWMPMLRAIGLYDNGRPIYDTLFFAEHVKFQYPLTSLLPLIGLRKVGMSENQLLDLVRVTSWLAVWATVGFSIAIFFAVKGRGKDRPEYRWAATLAIGIAGITFYPIVKGYALGQIQTFLTLFFCIAFYCWIRGGEIFAGALIGLMILIKPHYALISVWFVLRKRFRAFWSTVIVVGTGLAVGFVVFGWREQMRYLEVVKEASRGYAYYPNLSMNGLMNRLLFNGSNLSFDATTYAPYHPVVYMATTAAAILLLAAAFFYPRDPKVRGGVADLCAMTVATTAASPMAWEHHYGVLFPAFAVLAATVTRRREVVWTICAYALVSNSWTFLNVFADTPVLNLLQSVSFIGVLVSLFVFWSAGNRSRFVDISLLGNGEPKAALLESKI